MPCRCEDVPDPKLASPKSLATRYKELMCQMCEHLDVREMGAMESEDISYKAQQKSLNLLEWYKNHLYRDYHHGCNSEAEKIDIISEGRRCGIDVTAWKNPFVT